MSSSIDLPVIREGDAPALRQTSMRVSVEVNPPTADQDWISAKLADHSLQATGASDYRPLSIFLRDKEGQVCGGLLGWSLWSWMHIDTFYIDEPYRNQGFGTQLIRAAERAARIRNCRVIELETFDFLALGFYLRSGYEVFGKLSGIGGGRYERYYLKKELT